MSGRREALTASRKKRAKRCLSNGQYGEARALFAEICSIDPADYDSWLQLAELSVKQRALDDAEAAYQQAAQLRPQEVKPALDLGLLYRNHGRLSDAEPWLRRAAQRSPVALAEYKRLGVDLQQSGQLEQAIAIYRELLGLTPEDVDSLNNLGVALQNSGQPAEALAVFGAALALRPQAHLYCNMANLYVEMGEEQQARHAYHEALRLDPDSVRTLGSLGGFCFMRMELDEALGYLDRAIELDPGFKGAYWNRSLIHLLRGNLRQGWREYESRFESPDVVRRFGRRHFDKPLWGGEPIPGRRLLVYSEQGFGDSIQFCRYLPLLRQRVDRLVFETRPELMRLMQTLPGAIECIEQRSDGAMPGIDFDCQIPLMSLARIFDTTLETIPAQIPYLSADPRLTAQWAERMAGEGLKVGVVWAGNPSHQNDRRRSMALAELAPLAQLPGIVLYSLQKGAAAQQIASVPAGMELIDLGPAIADFADTAAIIANLDLVVTVDTSAAHLAGALGRPVWVLLSHPPEWRWMLERDDSPWYPSMRLFRQGPSREWGGVVEQVAEALRPLLQS